MIVNEFEQLSMFSAGIERLSSFMIAMREADSTRSNEDGLLALPKEGGTSTNDTLVSDERPLLSGPHSEIQLNFVENLDEVLLSIRQLGLVTPDRKRELISGLDLTVRHGENLLIAGPSGCGKSSLLRAIAGLWNAGVGNITRVPDSEVYFLPQRPYCALGSLKDQLLYPSTEAVDARDYPDGHRLSRAHILRQSLADEELLAILDKVDLKVSTYGVVGIRLVQVSNHCLQLQRSCHTVLATVTLSLGLILSWTGGTHFRWENSND